jgi:hypothetical protein
LTDDRACGADDVVGACPGQMLRKLRFLMTDYNFHPNTIHSLPSRLSAWIPVFRAAR